MTAAGSARPRQQRSQSADGQVLGLLLLLGGVAWLLDRSEVVNVSWVTVLSALLVVLGVGMVVTARRRGGPGLFFLGAAMTVVLAAASSVDLGLVGQGIDDRRIVAATVADARSDAERHGQLFAGQLDIDLTDITEVPDDASLRYRVGAGQLILRLPPADQLPVEVRTIAHGGKVELPGQPVEEGSDLVLRYADKSVAAAEHKLVIHITMGFGAVQVVREGA